jgi:hypothetical protein
MASTTVDKFAKGIQAPSGVNPKLQKELSDIVEQSEKAEEHKNLQWGYRYIAPGVRVYGPIPS